SFRKIADVDSEKIHRNASDEGTSLSRDDDLAREFPLRRSGGPDISVGIADGDDRDSAEAAEGEGSAIADHVTFLRHPHLRDTALQLHDLPHRVILRGRWICSEERPARTYQVAMDGPTKKYSGRIGERGWDAAIHDANVAEQANLLVVHRMVGRLRTREMTHQQRDAMVLRSHPGSDRGCFLESKSEPVHSSVDVQRRAATPISDGDETVPLGKLGHAVDDRPQLRFGQSWPGIREHAIEHIDDR